MNLNKVILIGRISQQPSISVSKSGLSFVRFNIAITRDYVGKNSEEITDFVPLVAFDNTANYICKYFNKGDLVYVVGSIQTSQFTTKTGEIANSTSVQIDQLKSLEPKSVTQARAEKNGINFSSNENDGEQKNYIKEKPTFYAETNSEKDETKEDNPWELDL